MAPGDMLRGPAATFRYHFKRSEHYHAYASIKFPPRRHSRVEEVAVNAHPV